MAQAWLFFRMWASVAGAWEAQADYLDERGAPVTEKMLELTQPQPDERVLELGCGPGSVGLAAAARVAPGGEVVMSDVVTEMTAIAAVRAEALGLDNVSTKVLDLERTRELLCRAWIGGLGRIAGRQTTRFVRLLVGARRGDVHSLS